MATQIVIYYVLVEPLYQQMTLLNQSKLSKISKLIWKGYWMDHFSYSYIKKKYVYNKSHLHT
uniref:Putative ovule protein n=1 Tax=Solanum chacoense TaxID=4108 RepID=A0A0V0GXR7_SOLCH